MQGVLWPQLYHYICTVTMNALSYSYGVHAAESGDGELNKQENAECAFVTDTTECWSLKTNT